MSAHKLQRDDESPSGLTIALTWLVLVGAFGFMVEFCRDGNEAHARDEIPPLILERPQSADTIDMPPMVIEASAGHAEPMDGPMCSHESEFGLDEASVPSLMTLLLEEPPSEAERDMIERSVRACGELRGGVEQIADPWRLLAVLRYGDDLGAPHGFFLGALCVESAMRARPSRGDRFLGDWRDGKPRASGPLQLHENVWSGTCGGRADDPHDLLWAMGCYWTEVQRVTAKAAKRSKCKPDELQRVGEAAAANVRVYGFRCDSMSYHWRVMVDAQALAR